MTMRELHDTTPWWVKTILPVMLSALIAFGVSYYSVGNRVTALETHRADDASRLDRIERTLDSLAQWAGVK